MLIFFVVAFGLLRLELRISFTQKMRRTNLALIRIFCIYINITDSRGFEPLMELIHNQFQADHLQPLGQLSFE
jgi:hypothetical protein